MFKRVAGLLVVLALLVMVAYGQDESTDSTCPSGASFADTLTTFAESLTGEGADVLTILFSLREATNNALVACTGLSFTSELEGLQPVIGPVVIPAGTYRVTASSEGYMIVDLDSFEGDCGVRTSLFNKSAQPVEAQRIVETEGCEALISVSNTREPWTLEFEKLK